MEFYSVKHRKKVSVSDNDIKKKMFNSGNGESSRTRYAAVAETTVEGDKVKLTKFINKQTFDGLKVDEVN
ncbi:MAG: hypothetical protein JWP00_3011 [Chloroflexi bacterium]|jgi:hypothetical protein|nr:hypothetical protein [Chloroflexota bacterium]